MTEIIVAIISAAAIVIAAWIAVKWGRGKSGEVANKKTSTTEQSRETKTTASQGVRVNEKYEKKGESFFTHENFKILMVIIFGTVGIISILVIFFLATN